jgi:uncharacterized RDD family membrane protein YckC
MNNSQPNYVLKRLLNFTIDTLTIILLAVLILNWIIYPFTNELTLSVKRLIEMLVLVLVYFEYYGIMEYKYQKTIGKFLTKTKVIAKDGTRPQLKNIFIRTVIRLIVLVDQISYLFKKDGLHDRLSGTTVIKGK